MEIEKTLSLDVPPARVWPLLLDPKAMGACVPGMESIEVVSDEEYVAVMKVKISFITARFRLKTRIAERREPNYLRAEGTGEDASVASSLKQHSEMWLDEREGGGTTLRMKVRVDVLGRMGTFGLGVMKTKADRMWDEFGVNLAACLAPPTTVTTPAVEQVTEPNVVPAPPHAPLPLPAVARTAAAEGLWARLFGSAPVAGRGQDIRVELRRGDTVLTVHWPTQASQECAAWLRTLV